MKKYLWALSILVLSTTILTGCEKDADYYAKHPEMAATKMKQCTDLTMKAMSSFDTKSMEKLGRDKECAAAMQAMMQSEVHF